MGRLLVAALVLLQTPEATSLSGKPLYPIELPNRPKLEADLAQAEKDLAAKPGDADAIIWVGRRHGYLWRYREAIVPDPADREAPATRDAFDAWVARRAAELPAEDREAALALRYRP